MAGKKSRKGKGSYATYASENRALVNKKRKVAKHLAKHPKDKQTAKEVAYTPRKAPRTKGSFPPQKFYYYDGAGHKIEIVGFVPADRR
jgi:hypothetical protein|tara:strand:+ start:601 stop:864 length:264 start_codon:yes stop_codon:yes gene_type:complete